MAKAKLITRQETTTTVTSDNFNKGSELSFAEADSNFLNLRDTTFGVTADDSATIQIGMDSTLYIQGGTNVTTATNSDGTITINSTASGGDGFRIFGDDSAGVDIADGGNLYIQGGTNVTTATNSDGTLTINGPSLTSYLTASSSATLTNKAGNISQWTNDSGYITSDGHGDITFSGSTISSPSNADITLDPSGTGVINNNATVRFNTNYKEDITALSSGTSIAVDCSLASVFSVTLAHNATFTFNNLATGQSASVIITQDGSGSRTGAYTSVLFPGNAHTLSTGAADIDIVSVFNDGTSLLGNISKDYS